ncbi:hypothetical protein LTR62_008441 [Meristemomyces frigidus]|uniref:Uncharacterized protein n=1 Tax=Meristemomyces frigidus TaxID=1508187 RepID=A0AAN7TGQ8_9PEZI|nr:hypothetical protein LTR62_008441 [Meristemomyces frigidus]
MASNEDDDDRGGFPETIFRQMQQGHKQFMRDIDEVSRYFEHDNKDTKPSPHNTSPNIFISFKDFIDSNLNSLADSFRSLPDNIAELRAKMQEERERRQQDEQKVWRRWTGLEESFDHGAMLNERMDKEMREEAEEAALALLGEAKRRNGLVDQKKVWGLFHDEEVGMLDAFATPMLSPGFDTAPTSLFRFGSSDHRWLSINWFKRSAYSPVTLEDDEKYGPDSGARWRAAFEDLMSAALEKPMSAREQFGQRFNGRSQSTRTGPGLDWMLSLQCRGILPPQVPTAYNSPFGGSDILGMLNHERVLSHPDVRQLVEEIATPAPSSGACETTTEQDIYEYVGGWRPESTDAEIYDEMDKEIDFRRAVGKYQLMTLERQSQKRLQDARAEQQRIKKDSAKDWSDSEGGSHWRLYEALDDAEISLLRAVENGDGRGMLQHLRDWHVLHGNLGTAEERSGDEMAADVEELMASVAEAEKESYEALEQQRVALRLSREDDTAERTAAAAANACLQQNFVPDAVAAAPPKVDVLSSLTTTSTTRHPDGTVTTKVVLKQNFADGREETEEKIHTYQGPTSTRRQPSRPVVPPAETQTKLSKGWFWS